MIPVFTVAALRAAETAALRRTADQQLMRLAAAAVAREVVARLPRPLPGRRVLLLVGPGNNGGDALWAGAILRRLGIAVTALLAEPDRVHPGGLAALRRRGGRAIAQAGDRVFAQADAIVDGLVGIGARPPLRPHLAALADRANATGGAIKVGIDVPSGVDPDSGRVSGVAFRADATVTFGGLKPGLLLADEWAGEVITAELGLAPDPAEAAMQVLSDAQVAELLPTPGAGDDKFTGGVVGIVAGSACYPGAAVLATGAAVRLRPGLVRYAGPQAAAVLARWPEVVATAEPEDAGRVQAWVVGPGLGLGDDARRRLSAVLAAPEPVVVDADGLTLLAGEPGLLRHRAPGRVVLTPHDREFARLFPELDLADRPAAVRVAAARIGQVVLLKGHRTVVASPDGSVLVNMTGTGWLAGAGSGDVLSGVIGSLLAAGVSPELAAGAGAHLHGRAGERAERDRAAGASALWDRLRHPGD